MNIHLTEDQALADARLWADGVRESGPKWRQASTAMDAIEQLIARYPTLSGVALWRAQSVLLNAMPPHPRPLRPVGGGGSTPSASGSTPEQRRWAWMRESGIRGVSGIRGEDACLHNLWGARCYYNDHPILCGWAFNSGIDHMATYLREGEFVPFFLGHPYAVTGQEVADLPGVECYRRYGLEVTVGEPGDPDNWYAPPGTHTYTHTVPVRVELPEYAKAMIDPRFIRTT